MKKKCTNYGVDNRLPVASFLYWHDARQEQPEEDRYILIYGKDISFTMATGYLTYCDFVHKDLNPIIECDPHDCPVNAVSFPKAVEYWCYIDEIPKPQG